MLSFINLLKQLQSLKKEGTILTMSSPLELDHMLREEAYYMHSVAYTLDLSSLDPQYNPIGQRKEE